MNEASRSKASSDIVQQALEATRPLPEQPADCKVWERSGVKRTDKQDEALLKTDRALLRSNLRNQRCADWYEDQRVKANGS